MRKLFTITVVLFVSLTSFSPPENIPACNAGCLFGSCSCSLPNYPSGNTAARCGCLPGFPRCRCESKENEFKVTQKHRDTFTRFHEGLQQTKAPLITKLKRTTQEMMLNMQTGNIIRYESNMLVFSEIYKKLAPGEKMKVDSVLSALSK